MIADPAGPAILTAALTGPGARKADVPNLPTTPAEIAAAAAQAAAAGAAIVHVHLRDAAGEPTADLGVARDVVAAIGRSTDAIMQLSTAVGLGVPFADREALVEARPATASLNVCSMTFASGELSNPPDGVRRLALRMRELGVKPEIELYDTGHLDYALALTEEGFLEPPLHVSLVLGVTGGAAATVENLVTMVRRMPQDAVWQVVCVGPANLRMATVALAMGGHARTGMEDALSTGAAPALDNGALVQRLADVARAIERPPATVAQARALLGL